MVQQQTAPQFAERGHEQQGQQPAQAEAAAPTPAPLTLDQPAALILNPACGQKLGMTTNTESAEAVKAALEAVGIRFDLLTTERAGHATELARAEVDRGRKVIIAAGGDGTVNEVAQGLIGSDATLGLMPLGSVMNVARTLCIPRDLAGAAEVIAAGRSISIDLGKVGDRYFIEAAGIGLDAGLFAYFEQLDKRGLRWGVIRAIGRFLRNVGRPRLSIEADGVRMRVWAPMVTIANSPYVGAAYAVAPAAKIDDGLFDVVIFRGASVVQALLHLAMVAGGRKRKPPAPTIQLRARRVTVQSRRRPLPIHADGTAIGATPARFEVVPGALKMLVGTPDEGVTPAFGPPAST
jgi:YegS/Rv2252/BmrU family lipid kinase